MKTIYKICGEQAVRLAGICGLTLRGPDASSTSQYVLSEMDGWMRDGVRDESVNFGYNVHDYFRGSLCGHALSGATYLGPDCDGVEPHFVDAQLRD